MSLSTNVTPTQAIINIAAFFNSQGPFQQQVLNWASPDSLKAAAPGQVIVEVPALAVDYQVNLAALFPNFSAPIFVSLADITFPGVGFSWSTVALGAKQTVGPNRFIAWMPDGATALQSLYINNPTNNLLILQVGALTQ